MTDDIIDLFPIGDGWDAVFGPGLKPRQVDTLMDLCVSIAKVASANKNTPLFMRATSLHYKLSRQYG